MQTYVATKNAGKLAELRAIFAGSLVELYAYDAYEDVIEDAGTYRGNALLKARALARQLRDAGIAAAAIADDSGLEVDALDGRPGVYSARYAGAQASWAERRAHLLDEMRGIPEPKRIARFVSTLALIEPGAAELIVFGSVDGGVAEEERGTGGFGYDPVFFYPPRRCTFAELSAGEKNRISHRRAAANHLLKELHRRA